MTAPGTRVAQADPAAGLSQKEKRALREQARREFKATEAARLASEKVAEAGGTPDGTPAEPGGLVVVRTDADRARDAAVFLRGVVLPVLAVLALPFGYRLDLDGFTDKAAAEDARSWVPLLARYRWLDLACTWVGAPARLVARVRELARRRDPKPPAEAAK